MSDSKSNKKKPEHTVLVHGSVQAYPPPEIAQKHDAERKEDTIRHDAERIEDTKWGRRKFILELGTFVAVVIYASLTAWQACLTNDSLKDQRNALHVQQRPWIAVGSKTATKDDVAVEEGRMPEFYTQIENVGNTPAWNETTIDNIDLRCRDEGFLNDHFLDNPPDMPRYNGAKVSVNTLMPHDPSAQTGGVSIGRPFTAQDIHDLSTGRCILFYYGHTTFCDIFNHAHWRHFCSQYVPGTKNNLRICSAYNDGDEDHPELKTETCKPK